MRRLSLRTRLLAGMAAVAVLGAGFVAYQISNRGDPSFSRGGEFAGGGAVPEATTSSAAATSTSGPAPTTSESTVLDRAKPGGAPTTAPPANTRSSQAAAPVTGPTVTTARGPGPQEAPAAAPGVAPVAPAAPPAGFAGFRLPALGQYDYDVDGVEEVTLIGTRRLPERMVTVVHGAPDLAADQVVLDLRYSAEHEEREIVGFRNDGVYFDFEGGSVTFGPRTETSEAVYDPPMLQIPGPLVAGAARSGKSLAKSADGATTRTEDWSVKVEGRDRLTVLGTAVDTWRVRVDRKFSGASERGTRTRTYWFDPERSMWVKFTEVFHGERKTAGFTATYDADITATLAGFRPA